MAVDAGTVVATLKADTQQFSKQLKKAETDLKGFGKAGKQAGKQAGEATAGTKSLENSLSKMTVIAVAAALAFKTLTKAYDVSKQAAYTSDAASVFKQMGFDIAEFRRATKGLISDAELVKKANLAENMGITGKEFTELANIADAAAKKTGQSQMFMFDSIITGTARSSKLILDNLGIMVDWGEAHETYAKKVGKTVKQLSDFEKKQAEVNMVLEKGRAMVREVGDGGATAGDTFDHFEATLANVATTLGTLLIPSIGGLINILTGLGDSFNKLDFEKVFGDFKALSEVLSSINPATLVSPVAMLFSDNKKAKKAVEDNWHKDQRSATQKRIDTIKANNLEIFNTHRRAFHKFSRAAFSGRTPRSNQRTVDNTQLKAAQEALKKQRSIIEKREALRKRNIAAGEIVAPKKGTKNRDLLAIQSLTKAIVELEAKKAAMVPLFEKEEGIRREAGLAVLTKKEAFYINKYKANKDKIKRIQGKHDAAMNRRRGKAASNKAEADKQADRRRQANLLAVKKAHNALIAEQKRLEEASVTALEDISSISQELSIDVQKGVLELQDPTGLSTAIFEAANEFHNTINTLDTLSAKLTGADSGFAQSGLKAAEQSAKSTLGASIGGALDPKSFEDLDNKLKGAGDQLKTLGFSAKETAKILAEAGKIALTKAGQGQAASRPSLVTTADKEKAKIAAQTAKETTAPPSTNTEQDSGGGGFLSSAADAAGSALSMVGSAAAGLASGGLSWLIDIVMSLLKEMEPFKEVLAAVMSILGQVIEPFGQLFDALDPVLGIFDMLAEVIGDTIGFLIGALLDSGLMEIIMELIKPIVILAAVLKPVIKTIMGLLDSLGFFDYLKGALGIITETVFLLAIGFDGFIKYIAWAVNMWITIFTELWDWAMSGFTKEMDFSSIGDEFMAIFKPDPEMVKKMQEAKNATLDDMSARGKNTREIKKETDTRASLNEGLFNMPSGFKVASARFGSQTAEPQGNANSGVNIQTVNILANDFQEFQLEIERQNLNWWGNTSENGYPGRGR